MTALPVTWRTLRSFYVAQDMLCASHFFSDWLPIQSQFSSSGFPVQKHHHEGYEDHEEKQFKHKERKSRKSEKIQSLRVLRALRGKPKNPARLKQYWPDFHTKS
jgi:hypothetical protein